MSKLTIEQQRERNDRRLRSHRPTTKAPISAERAQRFEWWAWFVIAALFYIAWVAFIYLMPDDITAANHRETIFSGRFNASAKIVTAWILPFGFIFLFRELNATPYFIDQHVIYRLAHLMGKPLPLNLAETRCIVELSQRPGSPFRDILINWLAANEQGMLTRRERDAIIVWQDEDRAINNREQIAHRLNTEQQAIQDILSEGGLTDEVNAIKQRTKLGIDTPGAAAAAKPRL